MNEQDPMRRCSRCTFWDRAKPMVGGERPCKRRSQMRRDMGLDKCTVRTKPKDCCVSFKAHPLRAVV